VPVADGKLRVLEIGGGPVGIAGFLPAAERLLIDPLESFYAGHPELPKLRNPAAVYCEGAGEALPARSGRYDLVISENCLDHVRDVDGVLHEVRRVLAPGGTLYLTVNCRILPGYIVHRCLSALRLDPGHPFTFTAASAERRLRAHALVPFLRERDSFLQAWRADLGSRQPVPMLKAVLGVSEFLTTLLARATVAR
jgi:SAM-dependent methyltransferase